MVVVIKAGQTILHKIKSQMNFKGGDGFSISLLDEISLGLNLSGWFKMVMLCYIWDSVLDEHSQIQVSMYELGILSHFIIKAELINVITGV